MMMTAPYRLQIFLPDDIRDALKDIAHREKISLQKMTLQILLDKVHEYPEYAHIPSPYDHGD